MHTSHSLQIANHNKVIGIFSLLSFFVMLITFSFLHIPATHASIAPNCADISWNVGTESDLNGAIACFNGKTTAGSYTLSLMQNISLTVSTTALDNTTTGVDLLLEGNDFTVDGQDIDGVRPFTINANTTATLQNMTIIRGNLEYGGAIYDYGTLTINNSTISDNTASLHGGGIYGAVGSLLTINNSTLSGNSAASGGGISTLVATLSVSNSTISGNLAGPYGGGINNSGGTLTVSNSTISGNSVDSFGGGINNDGNFTISNSTISGNSAGGYGGGIENSGTLTILSSTISDNSTRYGGGGIDNGIDGNFTISNSIIANSSGGADCADAGAYEINIINGGPNFVEDNSCGFKGGTDPLLGPLADNGGGTWTHALLPGSPAIDAGYTNLTTDQRGVARSQGAADDIGAFESRGFNFLTTGGTPQSTLVNTPFAEPLQLTVNSSYGEPVAGGEVTFAAPSNGASLTLMEIVATIDEIGTISQTVAANDMDGSYEVTVNSTGNNNTPLIYQLTNDKDVYTIFLPVMMNNFVSAPDLVVSAVDVSTDDLQVVLTNQGHAPSMGYFWVDAYINPTVPPTSVNQGWKTQGGEGLVWGVTVGILAPGDSITLTLSSPYLDVTNSNFSGSIAPGSTVYVQVDSFNINTAHGSILESHEISGDAYNNIYQAATTKTAVFLPNLPQNTALHQLNQLPIRKN